MPSCTNCGRETADETRFCPSCGTQVLEPGEAGRSMIGLTLHEKYRILRELGSGSMGMVYLAEHVRLKKPVAIKVLHSVARVGEESVQRFQREGIAAGKFQHPGAIQIFDIERLDRDTLYLAMEFAEGVTLGEHLRAEGALSVADALNLTRQLLEVLSEAHAQGIVHRDLKPDNLMISRNASGQLGIKVLDFGLSKLMDAPSESSLMTRTGSLLGTPLYMSPEQCNGEEVDHRTDLYAVGLILFEALTARPAFAGESLGQILYKHTNEAPPSLHDEPGLAVPVGLDEVLHHALEKDRESRFPSAGKMLAALETVRLDQISSQRPGRASRGRHRLGALIALLAVAGVVLVGGALALLFLIGGGEDQSAIPQPSAPPSPVAEAGELAEDVAPPNLPPNPDAGADFALRTEYRSLLGKARRKLASHDLVGARQAVSEAHAMSCVDAAAFVVRGQVFLDEAEFALARADFEEALQLDEEQPGASTGLGWALIGLDEATEAVNAFEVALELKRDDVLALVGLGVCAAEEGRTEDARERLEQALALDGTSVEAHLRLAELQRAAGDRAGARDHYLQAQRHDSQGWRPLFGLGLIHEQDGAFSEAERSYLSVLEREPKAHEARARLTALLLDQDRLAEAEPLLFANGLHLAPNSAECRILLAVIRHAQGDLKTAIAELEQAVVLDLTNSGARMLLGLLQHQDGRVEDASLQFENVLEIERFGTPRYASTAAVDLGLLALERGDVATAFDRLGAAVEADPDLAAAHLGLGVLYAEYYASDALARQHFERYEELGGRSLQVRDWLQGRR